MKHFKSIVDQSDPLAKFFLEQGTEIKFESGATISAQGSPSDKILRVNRGCVRVCAYAADGDRRVLQFVTPGGYLALEDVRECITAREAVDLVVVSAVARSTFETELARRPLMQSAVRKHLALEIDAQAELLVLTGQTSAVERVRLFLQRYARPRPTSGFVSLPMCRRDIADHLGLSMETVSRAFSTLKARKEIALRGANFFRIISGACGGESNQAV